MLSSLTINDISYRLEQARRSRLSESLMMPYPSELLSDAPRPAAVLIPVLPREGEWHILYTRRNATLAEHSGQVAFPGGRSDPEDDSPEATALREAWEEIGLEPEDVRILGRLPEFLTITNYQVTPVVGAIPWPYELRVQPAEVSRAFTIPVRWLADPQNYEERKRKLPHPIGKVEVIFYKPYDGEVLWGASARFTQVLLRSIGLMNGSISEGWGDKSTFV